MLLLRLCCAIPFILLAMVAPAARADTIPVDSVTKLPDGILLKTTPGQLRLQVFSDKVIRVTYSPDPQLPPDASFSVIAHPTTDGWTVNQTPDAIELTTPSLRAHVDRKTGAVEFLDPTGNPLLRESDAGKTFTPTPIPGETGTTVAQSFQLPPDESIFGLGQHQEGVWNYRGTTVHLEQRNKGKKGGHDFTIAVPVLISSKGYGLLWDNPSITDVQVGIKGAENTLHWQSESGKAIDYYFLFGPTPDQIIHAYRQLTGPAPMFGKWAWGYWQSRERYQSQKELLDVAHQYRSRQIPIDNMIQDWHYWAPQPWGSHAFGPAYPDPTAMMADLHAAHFHAIISVWAKFEPGSKNFDQLNKAGFLYHTKPPYYDPFNPDARQMYWHQMSEEIFSHNFDGWWLDASEPELDGKWGEFRDVQTHAGPGFTVYNAFPLLHTTSVYQGQRAQTSDQRVFILTRSAYAGQQRNAAVSWSGDIKGDWATLKIQIPASLNFVVSGIPYWNTDIGGFFTYKNANQDDAYRELYVRWFQFGAFCPMFRSHGTNIHKEIWEFGPVQPILEKYDRLHYALIPYIYSVAWKVTSEDYTMMRPLLMDFGDDPKSLTISDQFMFGPALMPCPVTDKGATQRDVYLPPGQWHDFWTGKSIPGGQTITASAPLDTMPLFVKPGSILPIGPPIQYATEKSDPIELRVYPGADGHFTLYEDEGDNYNYEKGQYATIPMTWNEKTATLTIGARKGEFPGMLNQRTFNIVFVHDSHGTGNEPTPTPDQSIHYTGTPITITAPH